MRARILTASLCLPLVFAVVLRAADRQFRAFVVAITVLSLFEYFRMAFSPWKKRWFGMAMGLAIAAALFSGHRSVLPLSLLGVLFGTLAFSLVTLVGVEIPFRDAGVTVLGSLYSGFLPPHFSLLRELDEGISWLLLVLVPVFVADSAALFVGKRWGATPLLPAVSPAKTVEGAAASTLAGVAAGVSLGAYLFPAMGVGEIALISVVVNLLAQSGDLAESFLKRNFGVKDSGAIFPGHGGVLDRTDSLMFPCAFVYYYCVLLRR